MPLFSIIIPTYNRGKIVGNAIHSVLIQDFIDYEIILIDDGSTDATRELIEQKFSTNSKVRYFYQQNHERGSARNSGIKKASGEYIVFLDSDDTMHINHLQTLYNLIKKYPTANFIASKYKLLRNNNSSFPLSGIEEGWYDYRLFLKGNPLAANFCIKKENPHLKLFIENRELAAMEDWIFLLQNTMQDKIYIANEITVTLNDHDERSMRNNRDIIQKRILAAKWIHKNLSLSKKEMQLIDGYSDYFCAVHSYADNDRKNAFRYLWNAIKKTGLERSNLVLVLKILAGHDLIQKLK